MMSHSKLLNYICEDCDLLLPATRSTLTLLNEGATIPFIARYRKEKTGGLDETKLRQIHTKYTYYLSVFDRIKTIIKSIDEQNKLTTDLKNKIENCRDKQSLEDLYLPYKKRRKTKADTAIENGLGPLATIMTNQDSNESKNKILENFIKPGGKIQDPVQAIEGAKAIISQMVASTFEYRQRIRSVMTKEGLLCTSVTSKFKSKNTKYDMYYEFSEPFRAAASHRLLAIRRGEKENVLNCKIKIDQDRAIAYLESKLIHNSKFSLITELKDGIKHALIKSLMPSIQTECFQAAYEKAESISIHVFSKNLFNLLLAPPVGSKMIMGIDPGFRTGCKIAIVDRTSKFQTSETIFPVPPVSKIEEAKQTVLELVEKYQVELIAIGNGTGSKETMQFIKKVIEDNNLKVIPVIVNESGASVYSASELAVQEYPDLDVTIRGAISIAHRLQDPLSELVKIDPKSIGVGQYQHDVNQTRLKESLVFTTELAVNSIGVDVNIASPSLLTYVSGIGPTIAQNIVAYREKKGSFRERKELLKVEKLGPKAYEQSAGFLRIKDGQNTLDNSAIHPESYEYVNKMAKDLGISSNKLIGKEVLINQIQVDRYISEKLGLPTLKDIIKELHKPGIDPRKAFKYANFDDNIDDISDLKEGMTLEGVVTNVTHFGAFVDIGVHQDGLIHVSKLSHSFVKNPQEVISVGEPVIVTVLNIDLNLKRIQLAKVLTDKI